MCITRSERMCDKGLIKRVSDYLLYVLHFPWVIPRIFDYYVL